MTAGKFFFPEYDSKVNSITSIFRYKGLLLNHKKKFDRFPIYIALSTQSIEFIYQGKINEKGYVEEKGGFYGQFTLITISLEGSEDRERLKYINSLWNKRIKLPISLPGSEDSCNQEVGNEEVECTEKEPNYYSVLKEVDSTICLKSTNNLPTLYNRNIPSLEKILLNFLDDFFNSHVFHSSPNYFEIKATLLNSDVIKGIYLKADFYLKKKKLFEKKSDVLLAGLFAEALEKWVYFIVAEGHKSLFCDGKHWFQYADREIQSALLAIQGHNEISQERERIKDVLNKSVYFLIRNYELWKASVILFKKDLQIPHVLILLPPILFVTAVVLMLVDVGFLSSVVWILLFICCFFGIAMFFRSRQAINLLLPRLLIVTTTSWLAILTNSDFLKKTLNLSLINVSITAVGLLIISGVFLYFEIDRNTGVKNFRKIVKKVVNVVLPAYMLSLLLGLAGTTLMLENQVVNSEFFSSKIAVRENIFELNDYDKKKSKLTDSISNLNTDLITLDSEGVINVKLCLKEASDSLKKLKAQYSYLDDKQIIFDSLNKFHLVREKNKSPIKVAYFTYLGNSKLIILISGYLFLMAAFALFSSLFLTLLIDDKPVTDPL